MAWATLLFRRHLRRHAGQAIALALLALLTGALVTAGVSAAVDFPASVDERAVALHAEDLTALLPTDAAVAVSRDFADSDPRITLATWEEAPIGWASFDYGGEPTSSVIAVLDISAERALGGVRVVETAPEPVADPVYLPAIFAGGGGYALGDPFDLTTSAGTRTFHVQGFVETFMFGHLTLGLPMVGFDDDAYTAYLASPEVLPGSTIMRAATVEGADAEQIGRDLVSALQASAATAGAGAEEFHTSTQGVARQATLIGSNIFAAMLLAFSVVIAVVLVVIIRFLVGNLIAEDLPAIGTLKALGYTSGQIIRATVLQVAVPTTVAAVVGVGAGHALLPLIAGALEAQTGLSWDPGFALLGSVIAVVLVALTATLSAVVCALPARRIPAVVAMRAAGPTHTYSRNRFPLAWTRGPLPAVLGLKAAAQRPAQSLTVAVVAALVGFAGVFSVAISANILADEQSFMTMLVGDIEDLAVVLETGADADPVLSAIESVPGVARAFYREIVDVEIGGESTMLIVTDDFSVLRYDHTYEGRMPVADDEIVLSGSMAGRLGLRVGDPVTAQLAGREATYVISGFVQSTRNIGREADVTREGMLRLQRDYRPSLAAIYLEPGVDPAEATKAVEAAVGDHGPVLDTQAMVLSQLGVYVTMAGALATGILVFGGFVIVLVIALVVHTSVVRSRRDLGISKAIGFTSRELVTQIIATHLPLVALGAVAGAVVGWFTTVPLVSLLLRGIGIMQVRFATPAWQVAVLCVVLVAVALVVAGLAAARVRRISAYTLLTE